MFSFKCAHCGHQEIVHFEEVTLQEYFETGLWPDEEYQEDGPSFRNRILSDSGEADTVSVIDGGIDVQEFLSKKLRGYKVSLKECKGFKYRPRERGKVISAFLSADGKYVEYLPDDWKEISEKRLCG